MNVIVVGGGKIGFYLSKTLIEHGHQPKIIEIKKNVCEHIANQLDISVINGDGSTIETLELADAEHADALICVTGQDQNNLVSCQLAKKIFHVPKTVSRVNNPKNAEIMKKMGVDIPISSTDSIARLLEREVDASMVKQLITLNRGEASINELQIPNKFKYHNRTLAEIPLPQECVIVSIVRDGSFIIPRGNTQICCGDSVVIVSQNTVLHDLMEIFQLDEK